MKTKPGILLQLLLNILVPVLVLFSLVFLLVYHYNRSNLEQEIRQQRNNIIAETKNLIGYYDFSMRKHEESLIHYMLEQSAKLEERLRNYPLSSAPLRSIQLELDMDTSYEDIYLISDNYQIINTTFAPDLGLDFSRIDQSFMRFFNTILRDNRFREDRFGLEIKTGRIRKYSYYPVKNRQYIIELGIYSKEADQFKALLLQKIKSLNKRYRSINDVTLYLGVKQVVDGSIHDPAAADAYLRCLDTEKNITIPNDNPQTPGKEQKEFIFLPVMDATMYAGYVLELQTNDQVYQDLLSDLFLRFSIMFVFVILLITLVVVIRSRSITKPLTQLATKTREITTENLGKPINVSGSREIHELTSSFNALMDKLRASYDTLEDKVIERTRELHEQKQVVEHKNQEIVESIQYARFIQQALLPLEQEIQDVFPESFVYYAPKDIIAGDFFWFDKHQNQTWFAVADCTGHGVPGAMVSVLCINALHQALAENPETTTGMLLDRVREKVVQTLSKEDRSVKDGMDICLVRMDLHTGRLQWTGANNPLWIIRNDELHTLHPDKQPVGQYEFASAFTTQEFQTEKGDWIFLFSDGYADQFGGPKNKKYKYATLKQFLLDHSSIDVDTLKQKLTFTFEKWKGENEQTDDVCVMGIRIR